MEGDSDKERAILEYAWKTSVDPTSVVDEDVAKLKRTGLSDKEIVEIQELISLAFETIILRNISVDSAI